MRYNQSTLVDLLLLLLLLRCCCSVQCLFRIVPAPTAGFQTHTTPVLMSAGERAELGTEKYLPLTPILEGTVILKPNPDYVEVTE
jgi:hypothetical protein